MTNVTHLNIYEWRHLLTEPECRTIVELAELLHVKGHSIEKLVRPCNLSYWVDVVQKWPWYATCGTADSKYLYFTLLLKDGSLWSVSGSGRCFVKNTEVALEMVRIGPPPGPPPEQPMSVGAA